jgi:uncharacterized oxidoreductase
MNTRGNTVLITGGATGIGFSLAESFAKADNDVIVCGRRKEKLGEAKNRLPQIHTRQCDLSKSGERQKLHDWVISHFRSVNILVNNAGIQRMIDFGTNPYELFGGEDEIETNLKAVIYLSAYFIPDFREREESAIINISSGLAFVPLAAVPVYCATKAAVHSFSVSLRHQLRDTPIKVFEIIPPTVDTELDRGARERRGQEHRGIAPSEVSLTALTALEKDVYEIALGQAQGLRAAAASTALDQIFQNMNRR